MEHSRMYERVKKYYDKGLWKIEAVALAVEKGWITGEPYAD